MQQLKVNRVEKYWYVRQLADTQEARRCFEWHRQRGIPSGLFKNTFMDDWLVAALTDDSTHSKANHDIGIKSTVDGYVGIERLLECFMYHEPLSLYKIGDRHRSEKR
jgi:hypothetical protein